MDNINKKLSIDFLKYLFGDNEGVIYDIKLDDVSIYSVTPCSQASDIADIIKNYYGKDITITDMTACVGGDVMSFAKLFKNVNAIEICKERYNFLKHNIDINKYDNVKCYLGDSLEIIKDLEQDVIYIDMPWNGRSYKYKKSVDLFMSSIPSYDICNSLYNKSKCIVMKIPNNFHIKKFQRKVKHTEMYMYRFEKMKILVLNNSKKEMENHKINEDKYNIEKIIKEKSAKK